MIKNTDEKKDKTRRSIKSRLNFIFTGMTTVIVMMTALTLLLSIYNSYKTSVVDKFQMEGVAIKENVDKYFLEYKTYLNQIIKQTQSTDIQDLSDLNSKLSEYYTYNDNIIACGVGLSDGRYVFGADFDFPKDYNVVNSNWYKDAVEAEDVVFGSVYTDESTKQSIVTLSSKIKNNNDKVIGVASIHIDINAIYSILSNIENENKDVMYTMVDKSGNVLNTDNKNNGIEEIGTTEKNELLQKMKSDKSIFEYKNANNSKMIANVVRGKDSEFTLIQEVKTNILLKEFHHRIGITFVLNLFIIALGYLVGRMMSKYIFFFISTNNAEVELLTKGDLRDLNKVSYDRQNELGDIFRGLKGLRTSLTNIVTNIKSSEKVIEDSMSVMSSSVEEITDSSSSIVNSTSEIAKASEDLTHDINTMQDDINDLSSNLEVINSELVNITERSKATLDVTNEGKNSLVEIKKAEELNKEQVNELQTLVNLITESYKEIDEITEQISNIAEQTNMLSINAQIESVKAGEFGLGFSVIASKVNELARESKDCATSVTNLMKSLNENTDKFKDFTNSSIELSKNREVIVNKLNEIYDEISSNVEEDFNSISETNNKYKEIEGKRIHIESAVSNLSSLSEELTATTEEISALVAVQNANLEEINAEVDEIKLNMQTLDKNINSFVLE